MTIATIKRKINSALYDLGFNKWYDGIPCDKINGILAPFGLTLGDGIYCGADGQNNEFVGNVDGKPIYFSMSWHRMGSGRFEIVAYVS